NHARMRLVDVTAEFETGLARCDSWPSPAFFWRCEEGIENFLPFEERTLEKQFAPSVEHIEDQVRHRHLAYQFLPDSFSPQALLQRAGGERPAGLGDGIFSVACSVWASRRHDSRRGRRHYFAAFISALWEVLAAPR